MIEDFVVFAVGEILKSLVVPAANDGRLACRLKRELAKLEKSLKLIEAFLQEAQRIESTRNSAVREWLQRIKDVACEADHVLDDIAYETLRQKLEIQPQLKNKVHNFFSKANPIVLSFVNSHKIKNINRTLDGIKSDGAGFGLSMNVPFPSKDNPPESPVIPQTHSFIESSQIVIGREEEVSKIVNLLVYSSNDDQRLSVLPVVGMAGLGKTTLAKKVYKEIIDKKLFDVTIWVCVSDAFDELKIFGGMLESIGKNSRRFENIDPMLRYLSENLKNNKFFLVLDDVWNQAENKWNHIKEGLLLCNEGTGNCVLMTTRSERVAEIMESVPTNRHYPTKLTNNECWTIIKYRAFGKQPISLDLEEIGKQIVQKCGGLPLIANVLGATMNHKKTEEEWTLILNSDAWKESTESQQILPMLKLSFDRLPKASFKQCFAYCAIFPKDVVIEKESLVQQWISQGYFQQREKNISMEDIGNEHFNFLRAASLFQDVEVDIGRDITTFKMHDAVHDLAQYVSGSEIWMYEDESVNDTSNVRLLNISKRKGMLERMGMAGCNKLRALFSEIDMFDSIRWDFKNLRTLKPSTQNVTLLVSKSKHLRYLDVTDTFISALPRSITELYHLQTLICRRCSSLEQLPEDMQNLFSLMYLDVSKTAIKTLPRSIVNLQNLETFRFVQCRNLEKFPEGSKNLAKLKHIYFDYPELTPAQIGELTSLQTLTLFGVGTEEGCRIEELRGLGKLKVRLCIVGLEHVKTKEEALRADLKGKSSVYKFEFEWSTDKRPCVNNDKNVLEGLEPHPKVQSLEIRSFMGENFPSWCSDRSILSRLVNLRLLGATKCIKLPTLGQLPCLEFLEIRGTNVRRIDNNFYYNAYDASNILFPSLKELILGDMKTLELWEEPATVDEEQGITLFPCLQKLEIKNCPHLRCLPDANGCASLLSFSVQSCGMKRLPAWLQECKSLTALAINQCPNLMSIPDYVGEFILLAELEIYACTALTYFPAESLRHLNLLRKLKIGGFSEQLAEFAIPGFRSTSSSLGALHLYG